jgi:hypothetical protein
MEGVHAMDEKPPKSKKTDTLSEQVRIRVDQELKSAIKRERIWAMDAIKTLSDFA